MRPECRAPKTRSNETPAPSLSKADWRETGGTEREASPTPVRCERASRAKEIAKAEAEGSETGIKLTESPLVSQNGNSPSKASRTMPSGSRK
jgi:hypothetical protein